MNKIKRKITEKYDHLKKERLSYPRLKQKSCMIGKKARNCVSWLRSIQILDLISQRSHDG